MLVVSLHDVSPLTRSRCERILAALARQEIERTALLVIPDHHGRGHFLRDEAFCGWLRSLAAAGHEIVAHGYTHRRERRPGESVAARLTTRYYTADEGEFFDLSRPEAAALAARATADLREAGLEARGFIAPAWLLGREAEAGVRDAGMEYTTRLREVLDLRTGRRTVAQSQCWSTRARWRRVISLGWNALLHRRLRAAPMLRVAIHPPEIEHPAVWRQIERQLGDARRRRPVGTYWDWVCAGRGA